MNALTFKLKTKPQQSVDCSPLTPDKIDKKPIADIAAIELKSGKQRLRADALFDISGEDSGNVVFTHSCDRLACIGKEMAGGNITVHGDAGAYLGLQMLAGQVTVHGNAGAFVASGMQNGMIHIQGNAGDFLGSAVSGDKKGMSGGLVIITGNVGDRAGDLMRRGTVLIEGNAGNYCGSRMLAGTIGILGNAGNYAGYGMQRGTLLMTQTPILHPTIQDCGTHTLPFLDLMFKSFAGLPTRFAEMRPTRVRRYAGDLANNGKGEILILQPE